MFFVFVCLPTVRSEVSFRTATSELVGIQFLSLHQQEEGFNTHLPTATPAALDGLTLASCFTSG